VWGELEKEARIAFAGWKQSHPDAVLDENDFYMVAEVYGYGISGGRLYNYGDREVDFYAQGIKAMINFEFKESAKMSCEQMFASYSDQLNGPLKGVSVLNYASSHDDGSPFDRDRTKPFETGTKLLLCPGASQVYYGDESCRELVIPGTRGDAALRGLMNWEEIESNTLRSGVHVADVLIHYQKLGRFRRDHPAVGAGRHQMISETPYIFSRVYESESFSDRVVVGMQMEPGKKQIDVNGLFEEETILKDYYSGAKVTVKNGKVTVDSPYDMVLLGV